MSEKDEIIDGTLRALLESREELKARLMYLGYQDLEWRESPLARFTPQWIHGIFPNRWLGSWVPSGHISR